MSDDAPVSRIQRAAFHTALGPLNFIHGLPEHAPHEPDTLALICGLIGTWLWALPFAVYWGWI